MFTCLYHFIFAYRFTRCYFFVLLQRILHNKGYRMVNARLRDPCLKIRDRIIKVQDFETVQCAVSPRFRDSCLECRDFETGLIFSEMHHFLLDHSIPLLHRVRRICAQLDAVWNSSLEKYSSLMFCGLRDSKAVLSMNTLIYADI